MGTNVLALAGGVGGAKLALGLSRLLCIQELTVVVNTGDDEEFHGLHVSPDLDTVMYALAGLANQETGWGLAGDQLNAMNMLRRYGAPTWFNLGDMDLATHIHRSQLLRAGWTLSQVTRELCQRLAVHHTVAPMTDEKVATVVETEEGDLPFQVYFVERECRPVARGIRFQGIEDAQPSLAFTEALKSATALVFCPSNPFLSIAPILALPAVRRRVREFTGPRLAVSPIVGGRALRGPAAKMLAELGHEVSCVAVARWYQGLCDVFLVDEADRHHSEAIEALGMKAEVAGTVMVTDDDKTALARRVLELVRC